jgi:hypothetical protein
VNEQQKEGDSDIAGAISILVVILLVFEFLAAMWIRGIVFSAALFGLMSLLFGMAILAIYLVDRGFSRFSLRSSRRLGAVRSFLWIALVSSSCIALLALIFSMPLLFNGANRGSHPQWRVPSILG